MRIECQRVDDGNCSVSFDFQLIVDYDTDVEDDYLPHETFFARAKRVRKVECGKNHLTHQCHTVFYTTRA